MSDSRPPAVDALLPHRGRMLLVEEIVDLTDEWATTRAVARSGWPLFADGTINPLILVELVAQTAGIHNGLNRIRTRGENADTRGWLVGIKSARFHVAGIAPGQTVTATARNAFVFENLREIRGEAFVDGRPAAEVILQVVDAGEATLATQPTADDDGRV